MAVSYVQPVPECFRWTEAIAMACSKSDRCCSDAILQNNAYQGCNGTEIDRSLSTLCYTAACEQPAGVCEIKR
jgi:hypothetical protein